MLNFIAELPSLRVIPISENTADQPMEQCKYAQLAKLRSIDILKIILVSEYLCNGANQR